MLRTTWTLPDGNCMFTAFTKALGSAAETHKSARKAAIRYIRQNKEDFTDFLAAESGGIAQYLLRMSRIGEFGDDIMLEALCRAYSVRVSVLKKLEDTSEYKWFTSGAPDQELPHLPLYLEHEHYENVVFWTDVFPAFRRG